MKGEIIYKVLDFLRDGAQDQADFINAVLRAGYGASMGQIDKEFSKIKDRIIDQQVKKQKRNNLRKYLSKLKNQGFISENDENKVSLSDKGKRKLSDFDNSVSFNKKFYTAKVGDRVVVISYDIPIAFNRERNILRDMLNALGFNLVHKSVWAGKVALPARFIRDLSNLGIVDFVEILEVTKNGTLKSKT